MNCYITKLLLCILLGFIVLPSYGQQNFEIAGFRYFNYPVYNSPETGDPEIQLQEHTVFLNIPLKFNNGKTIILNGPGYTLLRINNFNNPLSIYEQTTQLSSFRYKLGFAHKFNEKTTLIGSVEPGLASDFEAPISREDFLVQSLWFLSRRVNSEFRMGGGFAFTTRFGRRVYTPIFHMKLDGKRHRILANLPLKFFYAYKASPKIELGFRSQLEATRYNLNRFIGEAEEFDRIVYRRINMGPLLRYKPLKFLALEVAGGMSLFRRFQLVNSMDNNSIATTASDPFLNLSLILLKP